MSSIQFNTELPLSWLLPLLSGAGLIAWLLYRPLSARGVRRWKSLAFLRFVTLALVGLLFLKPYLLFEFQEQSPRKVLFLFDTSASMAGAPEGSAASRAGLAIRAVDAAMKGLDGKLNVHFGAVDETWRYLPWEQLKTMKSPTGEATHLVSAFDSLARIRPDVEAIFLFSDGADTTRQRLPSLEGLPPVIAFISDQPQSRRKENIAVRDIYAPQEVAVGVTSEVSAVLEYSAAFEGKSAQVELLEGQKTLTAKTIKFPNGKTSLQVSFPYAPEEKGLKKISLRLAGEFKDAFPSDNQRTIALHATDRKLHVLCIEGGWNWDYRFLSRSVRSDPDMRFYGLLLNKDGRFTAISEHNAEKTTSGLPEKIESLAPFDVVIIGNIERTSLSDAFLESLETFCGEHTGAVIFRGGPDIFDTLGGVGGVGSVIEALSPLVPSEVRPYTKVKFRLQLTQEGLASPVFRMKEDASENEASWQTLPELEGANIFQRAKPAATILAVRPVDETDGEKLPIIASHFYGTGRVVVVGTGTLWHWAFRSAQPEQREAFDRFWRQLIRWAAADTSSASLITPELSSLQNLYIQGQPAHFVVYSPEIANVRDAKVELKAVIRDSQGEVQSVPAKPDRDTPGRWTFTYRPQEAGELWCSVQASVADKQYWSKTLYFHVQPPRNEAESEPDIEMLRSIARSTGGKVLPLDRLNQEAAALRSEPELRNAQSRIEFWQSPFYFGIIVFLAGLELLLRKMRSLI